MKEVKEKENKVDQRIPFGTNMRYGKLKANQLAVPTNTTN